MIEYQTRDITDVKMGMICHGVNCQQVMGSGVARAIRDKWPNVYNRYANGPSGKRALGGCDIINANDSIHEDLFVANCYTQLNYGKDGAIYADIEAIRASLGEAYRMANYYHLHIFMPKIGCGLGGLDWEEDVLPVVEELDDAFKEVNTTVCILNGEDDEQ